MEDHRKLSRPRKGAGMKHHFNGKRKKEQQALWNANYRAKKRAEKLAERTTDSLVLCLAEPIPERRVDDCADDDRALMGSGLSTSANTDPVPCWPCLAVPTVTGTSSHPAPSPILPISHRRVTARSSWDSSVEVTESFRKLSLIDVYGARDLEVFVGYGVSAVCDAWEGGRPGGPRITKTVFGEVEAYDSIADAFVVRCLDDVYGELDVMKTWLVKRQDLQYMLAGSYGEEVKRSGRHILDRSWSFRGGFPGFHPAVRGQQRQRRILRKELTVVDLFSGTKSVTEALEYLKKGNKGWTIKCITLDHDPKMDADIVADICKWKAQLSKYGICKERPPDIIWASPECR